MKPRIASWCAWGIVCGLAVLMLSGCVRLAPALKGEPTPAPTPTPGLPAVEQELDIPPEETDFLGQPIAGSGHYARYISFENIRVFEHNLGMFLDGICSNEYGETLKGKAQIAFFDNKGELIAQADFYTAGETGQLLLEPGENLIYADIGTDTDVQMMDFTITITEEFLPLDDQ